MNKKKIIIIISIIVGALVIVGLYGTFASEIAMNSDNVYNIVLTGNSNEVSVPAGSSKTVIYQVTNTNKGKVNYGITYAGENIEVKIYEDSIDKERGLIDYGETKFIKLRVINTGISDSTASIKVVLGYENDSNLNVPNLVPRGHIFVSEVYFAKPVKLINFITKQYTNGKQEPIEHKDTDGNVIAEYYYSYQDENKDWGLMNDGLKVADDSSVGAISITDTDILTSGTEGNIRYFGPKPNNYIYFNCSDYSNQTDSTCEKWRIIGIVDGKVKIIRNDLIGEYSWDNKDTTTGAKNDDGSNDWSNARLMKLLNPNYGNEPIGGSLYWNSENGNCYAGLSNTTVPCDFTSTGLKNMETKEMISKSTWYLGGYSSSNLYPNDIYKFERTNSSSTIYSNNPYTLDQTKIGLMYASDYGYGTDLTKCNQTLYNYGNNEKPYICIESNWLFNYSTQWLIEPNPMYPSVSWYVYSNGNVGDNADGGRYVRGVRPTLYLDDKVLINGEGSGTSDNPYQIIANQNTPNVPDDNDNVSIIEHITNLYIENYDSSKNVGFDDGTGMNYYAPSVRLMNDGLNSTGSMVSETAAVNGTAGNIRYYGADDTNLKNYIYFNCSDYSNQSDSTCEKWRIIGIVDGKVKLIRSSSIGNYAWDENTTNDWNTATLKDILNSGTYYSSLQTKNSKTLDLIADATWYTNGMDEPEIYANASYTGERAGTSTWPGKIALAYPSDYGYSADLNSCKNPLLIYEEGECPENNWLTSMFTLDNSYWLITPESGFSDLAWSVSLGYVLNGDSVRQKYGVFPVLYLDSELTIESEGDGSSTNPYRIIVR